ncbi:hypothetical protein [Pseudomonas oryzihabitans]|uniref:hypothetical protein n=1 Tax=Pseudomonas oryzihabitans TaxID=47885 RepID=UPI001ABFCA79|nr:hypothetical protein [Pseudomonas oryzihabitans]
MNDMHLAHVFVARLEREFPHCNCLMSAVCPDGGAALCVMPKHSDLAITLQLDVPQLRDGGYMEFMLQLIREQLPRS